MQFDAHAHIRVLRPSKAKGCRSAFCWTANGDFRMNVELPKLPHQKRKIQMIFVLVVQTTEVSDTFSDNTPPPDEITRIVQ